jgi:hypothetical protein
MSVILLPARSSPWRGRRFIVIEDPARPRQWLSVIHSFGIYPIAFNPQGRATQYQISITAKIELLDHRDEDKVLWKNDQYRFAENFQVNLESTDAFDQESRAIREIAARFAATLVTNLLEGF